VEARLGRGYARLRSGDFFGAVEDLAHAKERWASLLAPYLLLAEAYGRNDRLDEMQRILEEAHARTPDPRAAAAWAAVLCRRLNQNDAGLDWARRALNVRAESIFLYAMGRREELRRLAQQLVSADPAGADGHLYLGIVELEEALDSGCTLEGERRLSAAWDELSRAAEIDPDACLVQGHLGRILLARGKLDEAKVRFREQTRRGAQFAQCWFHVGYQYLCEGLPAEAEEAYRGGMALGVGAADGLDALGWIAASDRARLAEAEELLRQAIEANPLNAWLYATLGRVLRERGNLLESAGQLLRPLEPGKRSPLTGWAMADTARRLARTFSDLDWSSAPTELEDRLRRLEDASRMTPAPEVSSVLAIWRLRSGRWGDPGRALEHAERAAAGSSFKDPQILGILARARVGAGLPLGAVLTLERGIQMRRADRKMQALLEECRQKALPRLASCASVDALFGRLGSEREALARVLSDALGAPEAQLSVRATFPDGARDEGSPPHEGDADARARGAIVDSYIQALLLELRGDLAGAAEGLRALTEVPDPPPEVFRRLAELQIASGRREEALATLERGLRTPAGARADLWRRWAAAALADPGLSPAEALGRLERIDGPSAGTRREDLAWLLRALAEGSPIRIDAGATEHPPECPGWSRDRFSIGGYAPKPSFREIAATECQAPYRTARFFAPEEIAPGYAIPLPPGSWRVTLHFAEIKGWRSGARRFGVDCEGKRMFEGLDPSAEGAARAMIVSRVVEVTDGVLDITFVAEKEEPMVCGMELERANP
jgi:tetratricopeptide (TPR) repeat protein